MTPMHDRVHINPGGVNEVPFLIGCLAGRHRLHGGRYRSGTTVRGVPEHRRLMRRRPSLIAGSRTTICSPDLYLRGGEVPRCRSPIRYAVSGIPPFRLPELLDLYRPLSPAPRTRPARTPIGSTASGSAV